MGKNQFVSLGIFRFIGAGSVVLHDIPPYSVVIGNPDRVIKRIKNANNTGNIDVEGLIVGMK